MFTQKFKNPLNDPAIATKLTQINNVPATNTPVATAAAFNEEREYRIFVPNQLATAFLNTPAVTTARVSLFFGVGPEMILLRLRQFFENESRSVLITIPGTEPGMPGLNIPFGYGISTQMIKDLMASTKLAGIDFTVEVMAGFSTGYRGVNLTVINELVDLSKLRRLIYFDAWYHHDDHPLAPAPHPFRKKNTQWAIETALGKSSAAKVVIYAFTHQGGGVPRSDGVPRSNPTQTNISLPNPPSEPVAPLITKFPGKIIFVDFEFAFNSKPAIGEELEKICLARLIKLGIGGPFQATDVAASLMTLVSALHPSAGSLGTLGLNNFTDLYGWISTNSSAISGFSINQAMTMVTAHKLLSLWTIADHYEMRHRMFLVELGKEPLLP
jgi:hypothetical protein